MAETRALMQESPRLNSTQPVYHRLCGVLYVTLCLCGLSPGMFTSLHSLNPCFLGLKCAVGLNEDLSLCIGSVVDWQTVQGAPTFLPMSAGVGFCPSS